MSDFEKDEKEVLNEESEKVETVCEESENDFEVKKEQNEEALSDQNETVAEEAEQEDELCEELEEIRTKFQEILDETAQTYLAGGDIQALDEAEENDDKEEEEISEADLCQCCGEKKRAVEFGEDYPYCSECRELMKHYPVSFKGILALICILILTGVSIFYVFANNAELIDGAISADAAFQSGKVYSAIEAYSSVLQSYVPDPSALGTVAFPKKTAARYAGAYASLLNYNYAYSVAEQFFSEKDLKNPAFKEIVEYKEKNDCYTAVMQTINNALQDEKNTADDVVKLLEALKDDENSDTFLIDYYEYIVVQYFGEKLDKQYDILTKLENENPDKWPIKYELCAVCSKLGKAEEAEKYLKEVVKYNCEDGAIYAYLADAYRFSENPDADKMLSVIEEGLKVDGDSGYAATDLNRVKAVAYLLKEDYDSAYDAAAAEYQTVMSSLQYGYSVNNMKQCLYTYQLCANLKEDKDGYSEAEQVLAYVGLEKSKDIKSFIKGKASLKDIITNGEGDLA